MILKKEKILVFVTMSILILTVCMLWRNTPIIIGKLQEPKAQHPVNVLLSRVYEQFLIPKSGLIHIGAHYAEELHIYKSFEISNILWIEADPDDEARLKSVASTDPGSKVALFAATDTNGFVELRKTSNQGQSSSIFKLKNHLYMSPQVQEKSVVTVPQRRLDDYLSEQQDLRDINYNILVMDIQGAELTALKGATDTLTKIDAIIAEVNYDELYDGAVLLDELDSYLNTQGFLRVDSISVNRSYGDALYVRKNFCNAAT